MRSFCVMPCDLSIYNIAREHQLNQTQEIDIEILNERASKGMPVNICIGLATLMPNTNRTAHLSLRSSLHSNKSC